LTNQEARSDGVLLTGATGFVGMELLARYLQHTDRRVYVRVRGTSERAVSTRVERTLHPVLVRGVRDERHRRALMRSETFFPYFAMRVAYDHRRAHVALRGAGIASTPLPTYFDRLVEFALAADWGRRQIPRAHALGTLAPPHARLPARARPATLRAAAPAR
jgi:hypothetical protein